MLLQYTCVCRSCSDWKPDSITRFGENFEILKSKPDYSYIVEKNARLLFARARLFPLSHVFDGLPWLLVAFFKHF
jgi:hypothetical protein